MNELVIHSILLLSSVFISAIAQLMLKKSSTKKANNNVFTFMNASFPRLTSKLRNSENGFFKLIKKNKKLLVEYLNPFTFTAYVIFIVATFLTIFSYRVVPLSMGAILGATEYIFIAVLSRVFLKESVSIKKMLGLGVIILGIVVYSI